MKKKDVFEMFINARQKEEIRVAVLKNGVLDQYFVEREGGAKARKGNVYVGKVVSVDRGLQAAFVDLGEGPHGFLSLSDIRFPDGGFGDLLRGPDYKKKPFRGEADIGKVLRKGQKVVVQVIRESLAQKGPSLTTYISIPGRFLVMVPRAPDRSGISRKIEDSRQRRRLKKIIQDLGVDEKHGIIVRTASRECTKKEVEQDYRYVAGVWEEMEKNIKKRSLPAPRCVYREDDLLLRVFRDVYSKKIKNIFIDSRHAFDKIMYFLKRRIPHGVKALQLVETRKPLFEKYRIEEQIQGIFTREISLPNGGSVVIEQTEALTAIDVNSGTYYDKKGQEHLAVQTNLAAAEEIARHLRLRDVGGIVCIDFIDMEDPENRKKVEERMRTAVKDDPARIDILPISEFGIMEVTRQKRRENVMNVNYVKCPLCRGMGQVKSMETLGLEMFRKLMGVVTEKKKKRANDAEEITCEVVAHPQVVEYVVNEMREKLVEFEKNHKVKVVLRTSQNADINRIQYK